MSKNLSNTESKALKLIQKEGVSRFLARQANVSRKAAIARHASYVDPSGKGSSNLAGYAIFVSSAIKKSFGRSVEEMQGDEAALNALILLETNISKIIQEGEKQQLLRSEIRQNILDVIELNKQHHDHMNKILGVGNE